MDKNYPAGKADIRVQRSIKGETEEVDYVTPKKGDSVFDTMQYWSDKAGASAGTADVLGSLNNLGVARLDSGKYLEAIGFFDRVLIIDPRHVNAWVNKGNALSTLGKPGPALACYDRALAVDPGNVTALGNKAGVLNELGRFKESQEVCTRTIAINPKDPVAWLNRGNICAYEGKFDQALECYEKSIAFRPEFRQAWENKALALENLGRAGEAVACRERAENFPVSSGFNVFHVMREWIAPKPTAVTEDPTNYHRIFSWTTKKDTWSCEIIVPKTLYEAYVKIPRQAEAYSLYAFSEEDRPVIKTLLDMLNRTARQRGYSTRDLIANVVNFVQSFPYRTDMATKGLDDYPRYPVETLVDGGGDCEDTAVLMAVLLHEMGYDVCIVYLPGHLALAVSHPEITEGTWYDFMGKRYYYLDTTAKGCEIGWMPDKYQATTARLYPMKSDSGNPFKYWTSFPSH